MADIVQLKENGQLKYLKTHAKAVEGLAEVAVSKNGNETIKGVKNFEDGLSLKNQSIESFNENGWLGIKVGSLINFAYTYEIKGIVWKTGTTSGVTNIGLPAFLKSYSYRNLTLSVAAEYVNGSFSDYQFLATQIGNGLGIGVVCLKAPENANIKNVMVRINGIAFPM